MPRGSCLFTRLPNEFEAAGGGIPDPACGFSRAGLRVRSRGDTLVVDTIGFEPGSLAGSLPHSDKLHVVERFTLNPSTLELARGIVADDPVYFADKYVDSDSVLPADAPFRVEACKELAPEYQPGRK